MQQIVIVGAGVGGLCTGIRLLHAGYRVTIYEKNSHPGGVVHYTQSIDNCFKIDTSASLPINPLTYQQIFEDVGYRSSDYYQYITLDNSYKVFSLGTPPITISASIHQALDQLAQYFTLEEVEGYRRFVITTSRDFECAQSNLLNKPFLSFKDLANQETLKTLVRLDTLVSAEKGIKDYVNSRWLRQFILFQTLFMGVSPDCIPNIYTAIAAKTQSEGLIYIQGGLSAYALALEKLFRVLGGKIHYNSMVQRIVYNKTQATGVVVNRRFISAKHIVINTDYVYAQKYLLRRKRIRRYRLSYSTFIIHLGLSKRFDELEVHNLYINRDFKQEAKAVFKGQLPKSPSLYIYYPSKYDDSLCQNPSHSTMNIMMRMPCLRATNSTLTQQTQQILYRLAIDTAKAIPSLGTIEENIIYKSITTPTDFKDNYNYTKGACFGIAHTFFQSMCFRPQIKDKYLNNLYYVGGSIHPGNGISIVMDCAKLVAQYIGE